MIRRPPRSTLFPYNDALPICSSDVRRTTFSRPAERRISTVRRWKWPADRKSTRLNSSHLVISYAVFCLKKKNGDAGSDNWQGAQMPRGGHHWVFDGGDRHARA